MANPEHLKILKKGVEVWNKWRMRNPDVKPDLSGANLSDALLSWADLRGADLSRANLIGAVLFRANLSGADLRVTDLSEANLREADLREANLRHADLSSADLWKADLWQADLWQADLRYANLSSADLSEADLRQADLSYANLSSAHLRQAKLSYANLSSADLSEADLSSADLWEAVLRKANLNGTILERIRISGTVFGDVDLSNAIGLENVLHSGPSIIGIDTIYRSGGKIPEAFLRGCGVPENFIQYMSSLTGKAFEFYSCFISYSSKDQDFAERLYSDLQSKGVRCWFAPEDIKGGKKIHTQLDEAIKLHEKLLLVISENSMNSDWVANEIKRARKREKESGRQKLFPIRLIDFDLLREWELFDSDTATDLAAEVRSYFIPDFSQWKNHDSYQKAFDRLMRDLKADEPAGSN